MQTYKGHPIPDEVADDMKALQNQASVMLVRLTDTIADLKDASKDISTLRMIVEKQGEELKARASFKQFWGPFYVKRQSL